MDPVILWKDYLQATYARDLDITTEEPWDWGQTLAHPSKALVINSVKTRKQEQIHMHICPVRTGKPAGIRKFLGGLPTSEYATLTQVKDREDWWCRVQKNPNTPITGVLGNIQSMAQQPGCKDLIGAAVLTGINDYKWVCITTALNVEYPLPAIPPNTIVKK